MPFNIDQHVEDLVHLRHHLHSLAEVSGSEDKTAAAISDFIEKTEPRQLHSGVGGNGILATYEGSGESPHILIRCELDALPIPDLIQADYRSTTDGTGHKCGHDGHMSIVCGVARCLADRKLPQGRVTLLFQPSEETGEGARRILEDDRFQELDPDYCFALHNLPGFKKHQIVFREEIFAAASVGLTIGLKGNTAHAAHPEQGTSPALAVSQLIQTLSAVPQFYSSLSEAVKVTVIHARLGERAFGTSPGEATLMATLRTYSDETLGSVKERCLKIARGLSDSYGLEMSHEWVEPFPATVNDSRATAYVSSAAEALDLPMAEKKSPFGWSEDFGHFSRAYPAAMFGLGVGENHPALHAEAYDFPDEVISTGVSMFMQIIKEVISDS